MKNFLSIIIFYLLISVTGKAQSHYEIITDSTHNNEKIWRGIVTKSDLENNPAFTWYAESQRIYPTPNAAAVEGLRKNKDNVNILIFGGTWCEDSHFILPKFFKIQEASGFPEDRITIYEVDRNKHSIGTIAEDLHVTHTPTIIVMKNGKEVGRLVEYGKTGKWDQEFADIFSE